MEQYYTLFWLLPVLALVCFVQTMFFTMVSRARQSGDPNYYRKVAWASNSVWFISQVFMFKMIWVQVMAGDWVYILTGGAVNVLFTTEGGVFMMKVMLGSLNVPVLSKWCREEGLKQVGAK